MSRERQAEAASAVDECDWRAAAQSECAVMITSVDREERHGSALVIHEQGHRRHSVFVERDCGAGWPPVASTDPAVAIGLFQVHEIRRGFDEAGGGTLFLDRIELLFPVAQKELLSLMEVRSRDDVGKSPRIITGASKRLLPAIVVGRLDESLFYRLNLIHLDFTTNNGHGSLVHTSPGLPTGH